jgi:hypothetical protein
MLVVNVELGQIGDILKNWPSDMKMRCVLASKGREELFVS